MIIAISGTPGTGKTGVAKSLAKKLNYEFIGLNKLAEEKEMYIGYDEKRGCKIVDIRALKKEVGKLKGDFVLESHYAHDMPSDIVIILRSNPGELRKRLGKRGWPKEKVEENVEAEIMEVCKNEALERGKKIHEIDTTGKRADEVADRIIGMMSKAIKA